MSCSLLAQRGSRGTESALVCGPYSNHRYQSPSDTPKMRQICCSNRTWSQWEADCSGLPAADSCSLDVLTEPHSGIVRHIAIGEGQLRCWKKKCDKLWSRPGFPNCWSRRSGCCFESVSMVTRPMFCFTLVLVSPICTQGLMWSAWQGLIGFTTNLVLNTDQWAFPSLTYR